MRNRVLTAVVACSAVLAACDGSPSASAPVTLGAGDAAALNAALFSATSVATRGVQTVSRPNRIATSTFSGETSFGSSVPCRRGGTVSMGGTADYSYDTSTGAIALHLGGTATHQACAVDTRQGTTFTLNGNPGVTVTVDLAGTAAGLSAFHATETGGFDWTSGGSGGHCAVDVTGDLVAGTQNVKLTGTFCGFPVDQTVPANG